MKKIFFLLLLALTCVACSNMGNREKTQLALCKNAYHNRNYEKVIEYCEPLSKKRNDDATIMLALAEAGNNNSIKFDNLMAPLMKKHDNKARLIYALISTNSNKKMALETIEDALKNIPGDNGYDYILDAKFALAEAYYTGRDISNRDYKKAIKLFTEIVESEIKSDIIKGDAYMILGVTYFIGLIGDNPKNNDMAYKYWERAYQLEHPAAKAIIQSPYKDLKEYFSIMQAYKRFDRYYHNETKIEEYKNWLFNGNGKNYLVKNKEFPLVDFLANVNWYYDMEKKGYDFAKWYLMIIGAGQDQTGANFTKN